MAKNGKGVSDGAPVGSIINKARDKSGNVDSEQVRGSISKIPNRIRRRFRESESSSLLTMFPIWAVLFSLAFTLSLLPHSGVLDCRDGFDNPSY